MSEIESANRRKKLRLTLDGWAVAVAFLLALLLRLGVLKRVPW